MTLARNVVAACVILVIVSVMWVAGQKHHHQHRADAACAAHAKLDPPDVQRDPTCCSSYRWIAMPPNASIASCAARCCGDDRCETFAVIVEEGSAAAIDSVSALRCERLPCCVLRDQIDELVTGAKGVVTGVRGAAQQRAPGEAPTATSAPRRPSPRAQRAEARQLQQRIAQDGDRNFLSRTQHKYKPAGIATVSLELEHGHAMARNFSRPGKVDMARNFAGHRRIACASIRSSLVIRRVLPTLQM